MAKKPKTVLPDFEVKLAAGASKAKPDQLLVENKVALVNSAIEKSRMIENMQTELALIEEDLIAAAITAKKRAEDTGNFAKTVNLAGTDLKIQIQIKDAYSKMDVSMRQPLKEIFVDKYPVMFDDITINTLIDDKEKVKELKLLLGNRWSEFFTTDESVKPSKEFQKTYFSLRDALKPAQKVVVQKVLDACQSSPAVKYPK